MPLYDHQEIKDALLKKAMTWQEALAIIIAGNTRPWHTKEWKERRDGLIKDRCEQCGSEEKPMVLQHLRQPVEFSSLKRIVHHHVFEAWKQNSPIVMSERAPVERNACPRCSSTALYQMKTGDRGWKCHGKKNGRECGHEFSTPATVQGLSPEQKKAYSAEWRAKAAESYARFQSEYDDYIGTQAVLLSIEEHVRYMSFQDTVTFCKKCAYLWDVHGKQLCRKCGLHYHALGRSGCSQCDTENYSLCEVCHERYHPKGYSTCYECRGRQGISASPSASTTT